MQAIPCAEVKRILSRGGQLVDVRTPMEFYQGALPGAVNIPVQSIQAAQSELDPERPVVVYCRSGQRSAFAKMWLASMGFDEVHDIGAAYPYIDCIDGAERDTAAA